LSLLSRDDRKSNKHLGFRVTQQEYDDVNQSCKELGVSVKELFMEFYDDFKEKKNQDYVRLKLQYNELENYRLKMMLGLTIKEKDPLKNPIMKDLLVNAQLYFVLKTPDYEKLDKYLDRNNDKLNQIIITKDKFVEIAKEYYNRDNNDQQTRT